MVLFHLKDFGIYPFAGENHVVDLFFIISGFVIAGVYEKTIRSAGIAQFLKRRLLRLYPTYGLSLLIIPAFSVFISMITSKPYDTSSVWISLPFQAIYLPSPPSIVPPNRSAFLLNGPAWSLLWELLINIAYAACLPVLSNRVLGLIVAAAAAMLVALHVQGIPLDGGSDWPSFYMGAVRVLFGFPLGVLMFRLPRPRFDTPFIVVAMIAGLSLALPGIVAMCLAVPLCVWLATRSPTQSRLLSFLGDVSYPLYATHLPLFAWTGWVGGRLLHLSMHYQGLFSLGCALVGGWLVLRFWDTPVRDRLAQR